MEEWLNNSITYISRLYQVKTKYLFLREMNN